MEKKYDESALEKAVEAVNGGMSKFAASRKFGVPRSTLLFRLRNSSKQIVRGRPTALTHEQENVLVQWVLECRKSGFPKKKLDLQSSVKEFFLRSGKPNPFKDGAPGRKWYKGFLKRHSRVLSDCAVEWIECSKWFSDVEKMLEKENALDALDDPTRIYNSGEINFSFSVGNGTMLVGRCEKNVYEVENRSSRCYVSVMYVFGADGSTLNPKIIYPGKGIPAQILRTIPDSWSVDRTNSDWMIGEAFYEYILRILYPSLVERKITFPVLLFIEGDKSHLTYQLTRLCRELKIILIGLYPKAGLILQPVDVVAFSPIREAWRKAVDKWQPESNSIGQFSKEYVTPVLKDALNSLNASSALKERFRASGLYPWNPKHVNLKNN